MSTVDLATVSDALADAADAIAPSVVQVQGRRRPASGIVYEQDLILTTGRALGREEGVRVRTPDGRTLEAELAGWDPATSLVLLRSRGLDIPAAQPSDVRPRVGHLALAVARSWSNALTATAGIVSVIGGPLPTGPGRAIDRVFRTTAPMHSGFAGGAFVDTAGRLLGVTTAAAIRGLGVVIPADIGWSVAARLAEHGTVGRGYLGVSGQPVRLPERQQPDPTHTHTHALLIVSVVPDSPADAGGMLVGDLVTTFDEVPVQSPVDLLELLSGDRVGRAVRVHVIRGGVPTDLTVTVGTLPPR